MNSPRTSKKRALGSLNDDDLQAAYDFVLERYALELLIGAHENSDRSDGNLVIAANHRNGVDPDFETTS